jgi:hypothetical protein
MFVVSATYNFKSNLTNEFRFGFTRNNNGRTNAFDGQTFAKGLGIDGIGSNNLYFNGVTELDFNSISSLNPIDSAPSASPTSSNTPTR